MIGMRKPDLVTVLRHPHRGTARETPYRAASVPACREHLRVADQGTVALVLMNVVVGLVTAIWIVHVW